METLGVVRNYFTVTAIFFGFTSSAFGAVIGLVLLAAGALVHALVSALRGPRVERGNGRVIEGEYIVVGRAGPSAASGAGPVRVP